MIRCGSLQAVFTNRENMENFILVEQEKLADALFLEGKGGGFYRLMQIMH
jgi:hypothetical protein